MPYSFLRMFYKGQWQELLKIKTAYDDLVSSGETDETYKEFQDKLRDARILGNVAETETAQVERYR